MTTLAQPAARDATARPSPAPVSPSPPPPLAPLAFRYRLAAALAIGVAGALLCAWSAAHATPGTAGDFDHLWVAARALQAAQDPWAAVRAWGWPWPLYYPLTTVLLVTPVAALPLPVARAVFAGVSAAGAAYTLLGRGQWAAWLLLSPAFAVALVVGQWSPLMVALAGIPALQWLYAAKPSVGLALWTMRPSWGIAVGGAVFALASVVYDPQWPAQWLTALRHAPAHVAPVMVPGGVLLLLALFKWRRPEARLLAALAVIPHSMLLYETFLLALIPRTRREAQVYALSTAGAELFVRWWCAPLTHAADPLQFFAAVRPVYLWLVYVPALVMVLRRPNLAADATEAVGPLPNEVAAISPGAGAIPEYEIAEIEGRA